MAYTDVIQLICIFIGLVCTLSAITVICLRHWISDVDDDDDDDDDDREIDMAHYIIKSGPSWQRGWSNTSRKGFG